MTVTDSDAKPAAPPDAAGLKALLKLQDGVVTRQQALEHGFSTKYVRQRVRRREWAPVYPGIYVHHTGPLTWQQRAWSAVLDAYPAALSHASAITDKPQVDDPIHLAVDSGRRVTRRPGVVVHYQSHLDETVRWTASPPRVRLEDAVLDVAAAASSKVRVIACLADAVSDHKTTADRLLAAVRRRRRMPMRAFIEGVLCDVRDGTCSVLEHGYLTNVERAHGLPTPQRQAPTTVGRHGFRDVDYPAWNLVVELDGRVGHDNPLDRDRDLERDLDAAVGASKMTLRIGWGQVYDRPCQTAPKIGAALRERGWPGPTIRCPSCPPPTPHDTADNSVDLVAISDQEYGTDTAHHRTSRAPAQRR